MNFRNVRTNVADGEQKESKESQNGEHLHKKTVWARQLRDCAHHGWRRHWIRSYSKEGAVAMTESLAALRSSVVGFSQPKCLLNIFFWLNKSMTVFLVQKIENKVKNHKIKDKKITPP